MNVGVRLAGVPLGCWENVAYYDAAYYDATYYDVAYYDATYYDAAYYGVASLRCAPICVLKAIVFVCMKVREKSQSICKLCPSTCIYQRQSLLCPSV